MPRVSRRRPAASRGATARREGQRPPSRQRQQRAAAPVGRGGAQLVQPSGGGARAPGAGGARGRGGGVAGGLDAADTAGGGGEEDERCRAESGEARVEKGAQGRAGGARDTALFTPLVTHNFTPLFTRLFAIKSMPLRLTPNPSTLVSHFPARCGGPPSECTRAAGASPPPPLTAVLGPLVCPLTANGAVICSSSSRALPRLRAPRTDQTTPPRRGEQAALAGCVPAPVLPQPSHASRPLPHHPHHSHRTPNRTHHRHRHRLQRRPPPRPRHTPRLRGPQPSQPTRQRPRHPRAALVSRPRTTTITRMPTGLAASTGEPPPRRTHARRR